MMNMWVCQASLFFPVFFKTSLKTTERGHPQGDSGTPVQLVGWRLERAESSSVPRRGEGAEWHSEKRGEQSRPLPVTQERNEHVNWTRGEPPPHRPLTRAPSGPQLCGHGPGCLKTRAANPRGLDPEDECFEGQ